MEVNAPDGALLVYVVLEMSLHFEPGEVSRTTANIALHIKS